MISRVSLPTRIAVLVVIGTWALIYVPGLFRPPLLDDADSVHAEAAREIVLTGDWITLHANGVRYLEKAPLMYWLIAASFKVFGVHDWSARLPLALGALALFLWTYFFGRRAYGNGAALFASLAIATALGPYIFTRFLIPDLLVGLWLLATFDFFLRTLEQERPSRTSCWGMAISCALNVLTKGLIGLVFPAAVIILYLLLTRNVRHLLRLRWVSSAVVFFVLAAPWHILAGLHNPSTGLVHGFFWFYFVNEHFLRYLNKRVPRDYDTVPLLLFWGLMLVWLLPWSSFLPQVVHRCWSALRELWNGTARSATERSSHESEPGGIAAVRSVSRGMLARATRADAVLGLWACVILVFFSFSTRQEYYGLPAVAALAVLTGGWLGAEAESRFDSPRRHAGRISSVVLMVVGISVGVAAVTLVATAKVPSPGYGIANLLTQNPDKYALSFGHVFDLTSQSLGAFRTPLLGAGMSLFTGSVANWVLRRKGHAGAGNIALVMMMILLLGFVHQGLVIFSPVITSRDLAVAIERRYQPGEIIVIDGDYEDGSTLNYYTGRHVRVLNHREANLWYGSFWPDTPHVFETNESLLLLWHGQERVYVWSRVSNPELLRGLLVYRVAESGGKFILSNQP